MLKKLLVLIVLGVIGYLVFQNRHLIQQKVGDLQSSINSDVLVMTDSNFDATIQKHEHVLVEFYAPWCGHCKNLAPHYEKAATTLKLANSTAVLGKVDATVEKKVAEQYEIKGFPTLIFFANGQKMEYDGGRDDQAIISWVNKKTGLFSTEITSVEQLNQYKEQLKVFAVLFTQDQENDKWSVYKKLGMDLDTPAFMHTSSQEVAKAEGVEFGTLVVFRKFDEPRLVYEGAWENEAVGSFLSSSSIPTIMVFDNEAIGPVFQSKKSSVILFLADDDTQNLELFEKIAKAQKEAQSGMIFTYIRPQEQHFSKLGEFVGADIENIPSAIILDTRTGKIEKYRLQEEFSEANLNTLIKSFLNGELEPTLKSEEIPENNDEAVKVIVGKSFQAEVLDSKADVLVKFYAPWCGHCKSLAPHWDAAAEKLKKVNPNIVIAKVDSTLNEIKGIEIQGFPTIKFFPGNDKSNVQDYNGQRTTEGILEWLKENTTHEWVEITEEQQQEEQKEEQQEEKKEDQNTDL